MVYNQRKHKRIVRDIITGKIISDEEAVSIDNLPIAYAKLINPDKIDEDDENV